MIPSDLIVEVRDVNLTRQGVLLPRDYTDLEYGPVVNGVGYWKITLTSSHALAAVLRQPGSGLIITTPTDIFSGPTLSPESNRTLDNVAGTITFTGVSDDQLLWDRLAYPDPTTADTTAQAYDYDKRTGLAEDLLHAYVSANVGPTAPVERINPNLTMGNNLSRGASITKQARFDVLGDILAEIANANALRFRVVQRASILVFETDAAQDLSKQIRLDVDNNTLAGHKISTTAPTATHAIVGAQDVTFDRYFATVTTTDSVTASTAWGRRIERFVNETYTPDVATFTQGGNELLATEGVTAISAQAIPLDDNAFVFGKDWKVGDSITIVAERQELLSTVSGYVVKGNSDGVKVGVILGDATGFTPQAVVSKKVASLAARVSLVERTAPVTQNFHASRCNSAGTSITTSGTDQAVPWPTLQLADGIAYSSGTFAFTIPKAGRYHIDTALVFAANSVGTRGVRVYVNGVFFRQSIAVGSASGPTGPSLSLIYKFAKGDTLTVYANQTSGGALALASAGSANFVDISYIGPGA